MLKRKQEHAPDKGEQDGRELFQTARNYISWSQVMKTHLQRVEDAPTDLADESGQ